MIILSGVTAVMCAESPTGGKGVSYLPLSYRKAWPTHTVPEYPCCRPTQPVHRAPLSLDTSTKTSFQKIFPTPFSQFCSQRAQRHNADKQLWVLSTPPPTLSCLSELPRVSSYQKLFRSQDTTAICKWLKKLKLNRNPIELKITVDYSRIGWGVWGEDREEKHSNKSRYYTTYSMEHLFFIMFIKELLSKTSNYPNLKHIRFFWCKILTKRN